MKVGLITFHGSHNYGSVLQAYATEKLVEKLGYDCEIINFRMKSQKEYYSLLKTNYGLWTFGQDVLMLPIHGKRKERARKFEEFISNFHLSGRELSNYEDLKEVSDKYDIYLTGSDQIWSNRIPELVKSDKDYTGVYFLDFAEESKPRVAFSSSIGEINIEDLKKKKEWLDKFSQISTREKYGVDLLTKITGKDIKLTIDPTLMIDKSVWSELVGHERLIKEKYIFLYTLRGYKNGRLWAQALEDFSARTGLKFVCVSPFFPIKSKAALNVPEAGPKDFLNLIANAELVFTDSFHGTAFSINFNKPFYSFTGTKAGDNRKLEVMKLLGVEDRAIEKLDEIKSISDYSMDYSMCNENLGRLRNAGVKYLGDALEAAKQLL